MTAEERIQAILEYSGRTKKQLARDLGWTRSEILTKIMNGTTKSINEVTAKHILNKFPEISPSWLLSDEGAMFSQEVTIPPKTALEINSLLEQIEEADGKILDLLSILSKR